MTKVSVIIPTYNCVEFISVAIESVLKQTFQDFEIIVIDDGSKDKTRETIKQYVDQQPDKIRYIYQENQGLAMARNRGIKESRGELIALLDADDKWCPQRLEEGVKVIGSDHSIGFVHANISRITESGETIGTPTRNARFLSGSIFEYLFLRNAHIACPTVLFRKECCNKVGLFDENLTRLGCEDRELWLRIAREYRIEYLDKVLAYYRVRPSSMSKNLNKMLEARLYIVNKFCPEGQNDKLRKLALAKIYRDLGDELLLEHQFGAAKKQYQKSLSFRLFSVWTWINLVKTMLKVKIKYAS